MNVIILYDWILICIERFVRKNNTRLYQWKILKLQKNYICRFYLNQNFIFYIFSFLNIFAIMIILHLSFFL